MITSAFYLLFSWIVIGVSNLLPTGSFLPTNFSSLISDFIALAYSWNWLLPIGTVLTIITTAMGFLGALLIWRSGKYLIALFRGN